MTNTSKKQLEQNIKKPFFSLAPNATVKVSIGKLAFQPIKLLFKNFSSLILLGVPFAILLTLCSMLAGRSSLCNIDSGIISTDFHCSDSVESYYLDVFIRFLLICIFIIKWHQIALNKEKFSLKSICFFTKKDIKGFGFIAAYAVINLLPLVGLLILIMRVPNPNWKIELVFFTCVAWVFLLPLILVRFYSLLAFALENNKLPSLKDLWQRTSGNMLKLLLGTGLIVFIALILFMQYYSFILKITDYSLLTAISVEFEYDFIVILFAACFMNYCHTQKELLYKGDNDVENN
ncbi:MAG: hypothetical protein IJ529_06610 [Alphaproteobacteria bacterium]|nr:hypothetical protein [Alphaproteobacteria bacterium]MBQ8678119.1 hypothetical protein [Alphaproteobacteria bacterium]